MDRDLCLTLLEEVKKIRESLVKIQGYQKSMEDHLEDIASNTTPSTEPAEPAET